jgi:cytochrome c553
MRLVTTEAPCTRRPPVAIAVLLAAALWAVPARAADSTPPAKKASSCVACHTDAGKLKAEAATVPVPVGSALQAGKG